MTNPSELVREVRFLLDRLNDFEPYLEEGETFRQYAGHVSPSVERLRSLAADTIDRLTSTGEAVKAAFVEGYMCGVGEVDSATEEKLIEQDANALWEHSQAKAAAASPREGHVEVPDGMVLVPRRPTEAMMQAGLYQSSADSEWADVYSIWTDMVSVAERQPESPAALPHNQGETKP